MKRLQTRLAARPGSGNRHPSRAAARRRASRVAVGEKIAGYWPARMAQYFSMLWGTAPPTRIVFWGPWFAHGVPGGLNMKLPKRQDYGGNCRFGIPGNGEGIYARFYRVDKYIENKQLGVEGMARTWHGLCLKPAVAGSCGLPRGITHHGKNYRDRPGDHQ